MAAPRRMMFTMQRDTDPSGALARLLRDIGERKGLPPVERWNPPFCGDLDMRIAADGAWFYLGTPIGRPALVRLFASVLKREGDAYFLVTPVEKVGIKVDDAPFQAVRWRSRARETRAPSTCAPMSTISSPSAPATSCASRKPRRTARTPYVHVRSGLWARVTRALAYDLIALGEERAEPGGRRFGVAAGGMFHGASWLEPDGNG